MENVVGRIRSVFNHNTMEKVFGAIAAVSAIVFATVAIALLAKDFNSDAVPEIKAAAQSRITEGGFTIVAYEGYKSGGFAAPGGKVYYIVERNGKLYQMMLAKWGSEIHIYDFKEVK